MGGGTASRACRRSPKAPGQGWPLGAMPLAGRAPGELHPRCGAASGRHCSRRVGRSGSEPGVAPGGTRALGPGPAGQGRWRSSPLGPAREPLHTPHLAFLRSAVGVVPLCCRGTPGVEEDCGGWRAQRQVVEGARDGARRLVILMRISFFPLLQGARRCVWRRRRKGQRHSL